MLNTDNNTATANTTFRPPLRKSIVLTDPETRNLRNRATSENILDLGMRASSDYSELCEIVPQGTIAVPNHRLKHGKQQSGYLKKLHADNHVSDSARALFNVDRSFHQLLGCSDDAGLALQKSKELVVKVLAYMGLIANQDPRTLLKIEAGVKTNDDVAKLTAELEELRSERSERERTVETLNAKLAQMETELEGVRAQWQHQSEELLLLRDQNSQTQPRTTVAESSDSQSVIEQLKPVSTALAGLIDVIMVDEKPLDQSQSDQVRGILTFVHEHVLTIVSPELTVKDYDTTPGVTNFKSENSKNSNN